VEKANYSTCKICGAKIHSTRSGSWSYESAIKKTQPDGGASLDPNPTVGPHLVSALRKTRYWPAIGMESKHSTSMKDKNPSILPSMI